MKVKKPKALTVRRVWKMNPVTRIKESEKKYSRATARKDARRRVSDE